MLTSCCIVIHCVSQAYSFQFLVVSGWFLVLLLNYSDERTTGSVQSLPVLDPACIEWYMSNFPNHLANFQWYDFYGELKVSSVPVNSGLSSISSCKWWVALTITHCLNILGHSLHTTSIFLQHFLVTSAHWCRLSVLTSQSCFTIN